MPKLKNYIPWVLLIGIIISFATTFYYRLKLQDNNVLICHLIVNDVSALATNGIDHVAGVKDRQLWFYYNQFHSTLNRHPGRDYFLWKIKQATFASSNDMKKRGVLTETQINELIGITNIPIHNKNYYFNMSD